METSDKPDEPIRLSFSLTRLQRIINPFERLIYAFCCLGMIGACLIGVIIAPAFWLNWPMLVIGLLFCVFAVGKPTLSLLMSIVSSQYINTIDIRKGAIGFGFNGTEYWVFYHPELMRISSGLFGTIILRNIGYGHSFTFPKDVISKQRLKELIGLK